MQVIRRLLLAVHGRTASECCKLFMWLPFVYTEAASPLTLVKEPHLLVATVTEGDQLS